MSAIIVLQQRGVSGKTGSFGPSWGGWADAGRVEGFGWLPLRPELRILGKTEIQKAIHRIRSREEVDFRYLNYTLLYKGRTGHLESLFTGATIKHLPRKKLKTVIVEVPTKNLMDLFSKMVEATA